MSIKGYLNDFTADNTSLTRAADAAPPKETVRDIILHGGETGGLSDLMLNTGRHFVEQSGDFFNPNTTPLTTMLDVDAANAKYGIPGELTFDKQVSESEAAWKYRNKRDALYRRDVLQRNDSVGGLEGFSQSLIGGIVDPASMALNFVPIAGEAKWGEMLGMSAWQARLVHGAWAGAQAGVVQEGLTFGLANNAGVGYRAEDAAMGILSSTIFGTSLEALGIGLDHVRGTMARPAASGPIADKIRAQARAQGVDAEWAVQIAQVESALNPAARNASGASGVFQFMPGTWDGMGGGDPFNADLNIERGVTLMAQNAAHLRQSLGREPTLGELYLAHQQGLGGAEALLRHPEMSAIEALRLGGSKNPRASILQNGGNADMTAADFAGMWAQKVGDSAPVGTLFHGDYSDRPPPLVSAMDNIERAGAVAKAVDDLAGEGRVDVGDLVHASAARRGIAAGFDMEMRGPTAYDPGTFLLTPADPAVQAAANDGLTGIAGTISKDGKTWAVSHSGLPEEFRGQGLGAHMYGDLAQRADAAGAVLQSGNEVSAQAAAAWERLRRQGFTVERSAQAKWVDDPAHFDGGYLTGGRDGFVYKVTGVPKAEPVAPKAAAMPATAAPEAPDGGYSVRAQLARTAARGSAPGRPAVAQGAGPEGPRVSVQRAEGVSAGRGGSGKGGAGKAGEAGGAAPEARVTFHDPEIKALQAEVAALEDVAPGIRAEAIDDPEHLARAIDAFASCLIREAV